MTELNDLFMAKLRSRRRARAREYCVKTIPML
jgi:hypothetical protein